LLAVFRAFGRKKIPEKPKPRVKTAPVMEDPDENNTEEDKLLSQPDEPDHLDD